MCLIWFSYQNTPGFRLLLAGNRDEFFTRTTSHLSWRDDILAGWDEEHGGTWLAVNRLGQLAALTNYRDPVRQRPKPPSRGNIIPAYLRSGQSAAEFLRKIQEQADDYNPFNLLLFDGRKMFCFSNVRGSIEPVGAGVHTLSNRFLDTDWPKTRRAKELLALVELTTQASSQIKAEEIFTALADRHQPGDRELPATGVKIEWERLLAPVFIENANASLNYGTRSSAVVAIADNGRIDFYERSYQHNVSGISISDNRHVSWCSLPI